MDVADVWRRGRARRARRALLALLALSCASCAELRAARILRDAALPPGELAGEVEAWTESLGDTTVLLHAPRDERGELPLVVLVHGAVDGGARDPRLVALARALAAREVRVACPDLEALKRYRAEAADVERIAAIARQLAGRADTAGGEVALLGISIGGSYCLVAAARPELAGRVSAVLALGASADLERLVRSWMVAPRAGVAGMHDPLVEGRRRVLLGNLEQLVPAEELEAARAELVALLRGAQPEPGAEELASPAGRRLLEAARSTDPLAPELAGELLAPVAGELAALSPAFADAPDAPVFLLHGADDPIVPATEAPELAALLEARGARVRVRVTDLLAHVGTPEDVSLCRVWPLLRFLAAYMRAAGF